MSTINGGNGNDILTGGSGSDTMSGGNGNDTMSGGAGNDVMDGGNGNDTMSGGSGNDVMDGGNGNDTMSGDDGNDTMTGGNGDDVLSGEGGNDTIDGGNGNDIISGGAGSNTMTGGNGDDTFIETVSLHAHDTINGQNGNDLLIIQATAQEALLLSSAIAAFNASNKSQVFHFSDYTNGLLDVSVVNVEKVQIQLISNGAPVAMNDAVSMLEHGGSVSGNVLTNDSDPDVGDILSVAAPGTYVGTYGVLTIAANGGYTYALNPSVSLAPGLQVHDIFTYGASDGSSTSTATLNVTITGVNDAPTNISLSNNSIAENAPGAVIGSLTAMDPDAGATFSFSIVGGADAAKFEIVGNSLKLIDGMSTDFEMQNHMDVIVRVTDQGGLTYDKSFIVNVIDVNEAPTDIMLSNNSIAENAPGAVIGSLSAMDPDAGAAFSFSIVGGADAAKFEIVGNSLKLIDGMSADFEMQNHMDVIVRVTDQGGLTYDKSFIVNVTDVNEAPTDIMLSNNSVAENAPGAVIGSLTAMDPDAGAIFNFDIIGGADADILEIVGGVLKLKAGLSVGFEVQDHLNVLINVEDQGGLSYAKAFTINVSDVAENQTPLITSALAVSGTIGVPLSYTVTAIDADTPASSLTYVVDRLPDGMTFDPSTHVISGTPTIAGIYETVISVSDGVHTTTQVMEFTMSGPQLLAQSDGDHIDGTNNIAEVLGNDGFHAVLKPGVGDTVELNFHHDPTFFNSPFENSIDTTSIFALQSSPSLSFAGSLNLLVNDASVSSALTPIKTINFDFDSSIGIGLDPNGFAESIYVTNQTLIEYGLYIGGAFGLAVLGSLSEGLLSPVVNIHIDPDIRDFMANNPADMINVYEGYAYSVNLTNESEVAVNFEDRWGDTHFVGGLAPTDDHVLVDVGLNANTEISTVPLPTMINTYDGGAGHDTLTLDLVNLTKEDKSAFVAFKAAFDAMSASDKAGEHVLYQDATHSSSPDAMYSITFQNFEDVQLLHADLNAGAGNDTLVGTGGNDILEGYIGSDTLTGGNGDDIFVFDYAHYNTPTGNSIYAVLHPVGTDIITDFSNVFSGIGTIGGGGTINSNVDTLKVTHMVDVDGNGTINLADLNAVTTMSDDGGGHLQMNVWNDLNHNGIVGETSDFLAISIVFQSLGYISGATQLTDYGVQNQIQVTG